MIMRAHERLDQRPGEPTTPVPYWVMLDTIAKSQFESDMRPMPRYTQAAQNLHADERTS